MHIAINCRSFLTANSTGIGRYSKSLVDYLSRIDQKNRYSLYCPKRLFDRKRRLPKSPAKNFRIKPDFFSLGVDLVAGRPDVYHAPSPEVLKTRSRRVVVTVNDLVHKTFPESQTSETVLLTNEAMGSIIPRASHFICISESTRRDLEMFYPAAQGRTSVVYNGFAQNVFYAMGEAERSSARLHLNAMGVAGRFLLFVGTLEPRKNLKNLLYAFADLKARAAFDGKLVIAGMTGWMMEDFDQCIKELHLEEQVIRLGYLADHELRFLYNLCEVFVFPSFYEGFGFPIVEAMACGAAVVTSNVSSCGEVGGNAVLQVAPHDPKAIADAVLHIINDPALCQILRERSVVRAGEFSFERMAHETQAVYYRVMESKK